MEPLIRSLDFVAVPSTDAARSRSFYVDTLGLRPDEKAQFEFWVGDTCFGIWEPEKMGMPFAPEKCSHLALHVDDVAAARAALEEKGIAVHRRHLRHRRLPHGPVRRSRRQQPHAAPPVQAAPLSTAGPCGQRRAPRRLCARARRALECQGFTLGRRSSAGRALHS